MPQLSSTSPLNSRLRLLLFGPPKTGKTLLAGKMATTNANVYVFIGEDNESVLNQVPDEYKHRVRIVKCIDNNRTGDANYSKLLLDTFVNTGMRLVKVSEKNLRPMKEIDRQDKDNHDIAVINRDNIQPDDIIVIDSLTSLVHSVQLQFLSKMNAKNVNELRDTRGFYGNTAQVFMSILKSIVSVNCHIICIGHNQDRETLNSKGEVIETFTQVLTTSAKQGVASASMFNQVIYTQFNSMGNLEYITKGDNSIITGGTLLPAKKWTDKELTPSVIMSSVGVNLNENHPMSDVITYQLNE